MRSRTSPGAGVAQQVSVRFVVFIHLALTGASYEDVLQTRLRSHARGWPRWL